MRCRIFPAISRTRRRPRTSGSTPSSKISIGDNLPEQADRRRRAGELGPDQQRAGRSPERDDQHVHGDQRQRIFHRRRSRANFAGNQPVFGGVNLYTRRGDFQLDQNGFLVNGAGYYLMGHSGRSHHRQSDRQHPAHAAVQQQPDPGAADVADPIQRQPAEPADHGEHADRRPGLEFAQSGDVRVQSAGRAADAGDGSGRRRHGSADAWLPARRSPFRCAANGTLLDHRHRQCHDQRHCRPNRGAGPERDQRRDPHHRHLGDRQRRQSARADERRCVDAREHHRRYGARRARSRGRQQRPDRPHHAVGGFHRSATDRDGRHQSAADDHLRQWRRPGCDARATRYRVAGSRRRRVATSGVDANGNIKIVAANTTDVIYGGRRARCDAAQSRDVRHHEPAGFPSNGTVYGVDQTQLPQRVGRRRLDHRLRRNRHAGEHAVPLGEGRQRVARRGPHRQVEHVLSGEFESPPIRSRPGPMSESISPSIRPAS